nr:uncharacterized protein LOC113809920 [Penaeus vannamei]
MGEGVGGEAAAVVVVTLLAILGNALVVTTLLRRSLLHHPSNRLVLSLTASNLVLAVVVLPGLVASVVMGPSEHPLLKVLPSPLSHSRNGTVSLTPSPSPAPTGLGFLGREGVGWDGDVVRSFGRSWDAKGGPAGVVFGEVVEGGRGGDARAEEEEEEEEEEAMEMEVRQVEEDDERGKEEDGEGEEEKEMEINQRETKGEQEGDRDQVALTLGVNKMEASKQQSGHARKASEQGREITRIKASARIRGKPVNIKLSINYVGALERQSENTPERQQVTQSDTIEQKTEKEKTEEQKTQEQKTGNQNMHSDNLHMEEKDMEIDIEQEVEEEENEAQTVDETELDNKQRKMAQQRLEESEEKWEGAEVLCQSAAFLTNLVTAASALTVAVIALDRYLAIVRPMVYGIMVTGHRCLLMLAWCWVQALLTALPPLFGWSRYERQGPEGRCGVQWARSPSYTAVWVTSVFVVPVIVMLVCYYFILQVARNKCRRIHVGTMIGAAAAATSPPVTPDPSSVCLEVPHLAEVKRPSSYENNGVAGGPRGLGDLLDAPGRGAGGGGGVGRGGGGGGVGVGVPCRSLSVSVVTRSPTTPTLPLRRRNANWATVAGPSPFVSPNSP